MAAGDVLKKQAVAVIDDRTTTVCLHAAGQVKPVDEPFDTLNGPMMMSPFHVHCRTITSTYMPGFENVQRQAANAELASRSPSQRAAKPPPKPYDPPDELGLGSLPKSPDDLPGGSTLLDDVPDGQRESFVRSHPERFEVVDNGGGISETYWVTDTQTGDRWVLKRGAFNHESWNEVLSTRVAAQAGMPGEAMIAGPGQGGNGWVLIRHAEDVLPGYRVRGTGGGHRQIPKLLDELEDGDDAVRTVLTNFVTDEADAKGGNLLVMVGESGKVRLVPIDRSLSGMGWRGAIEPGAKSVVAGDWSLAARLRITDLRKYMGTRGSPKGHLELVKALADHPGYGPERLIAAYDDVVDRLKRIDWDDVTRGMAGKHVDEYKTLVSRRIELLESERATILKQMGVKADVPAPVQIAGVTDDAGTAMRMVDLIDDELDDATRKILSSEARGNVAKQVKALEKKAADGTSLIGRQWDAAVDDLTARLAAVVDDATDSLQPYLKAALGSDEYVWGFSDEVMQAWPKYRQVRRGGQIVDEPFPRPAWAKEFLSGADPRVRELVEEMATRKAVQDAMNAWAYDTAGDLTVALHRAAAALKKMQEALLREYKYGGTPTSMAGTEAMAQKLLSVMHDATQAWFKAKGITHVRLYRGYQWPRGVEVPEWAGKVDELVDVPQQALSSWSTSKMIAEQFASTFGNGRVVEAVVKVDDIVGVPSTGIGSIGEREMVLMTEKVRGHVRTLS